MSLRLSHLSNGVSRSRRISVIVPVLNEAECIVATLQSLQLLRTRGHEVIVVDGGSSDASRELAEPLCDRLLISLRGRARQMNAAAATATGDVVLFLHGDTQLPPCADLAVAHALKDRRRWGRFDVRIAGRARVLRVVAGLMNLRSKLTGIATGDQAIFAERALFADIGGFPEVALMEDVGISARLKRAAGAPARVCARATTSGRRWDEHGALRTIMRMWTLRWAYWRGVDPDKLARHYEGSERPPTLLIFARQPQPGAVKTRLAASVGPEKAAELYREFVELSLSVASAARRAGVVGDIELCGTPSTSSAAFTDWSRRFGVPLVDQNGVDLGARMRAALRSALRRGERALLIGTDCPVLDVAYLRAAARALESHDVVLGPAEDGGYVLVGLRRNVDLFTGITWSQPGVMAQTRARLALSGASWHELPTLWDVDTVDDLARWETQRQAANEDRIDSVIDE